MSLPRYACEFSGSCLNAYSKYRSASAKSSSLRNIFPRLINAGVSTPSTGSKVFWSADGEGIVAEVNAGGMFDADGVELTGAEDA